MSTQKYVSEERQKRVQALAAKFQALVINEGGAQWEEYAAALGVTAKLLAISGAEAAGLPKDDFVKAVRRHLDAGFAIPIEVKWING